MAFTLPVSLVRESKCASLDNYRKRLGTFYTDEMLVDVASLNTDDLAELMALADSAKDKRVSRAISSIIEARKGVFNQSIPNFKAFHGVLEAFLKHEAIDGWIYVLGDDGRYYPELITDITSSIPQKNHGFPSVIIRTICYGISEDGRYARSVGNKQKSYTFYPRDAINKKVSAVLEAAGLLKETQALKDSYNESIENFEVNFKDAFSKQFVVNGKAYAFEKRNYERKGEDITGSKVIYDMDASRYGAYGQSAESVILKGQPGEVPQQTIGCVFDLATHEFIWVSSDSLIPYQYDKSLRDKLVLPDSHRDLLDVLTSDIDVFVDDIVKGKSAGNVILCKGIPGVGKTLTAEVYSELIEKPLYAIHSGNLGTDPSHIQENLSEIFQRGKRWGCVLLMDEADVFIVRRGNDIKQNAIVAEFLRTLEYFNGLMFMTTNRPDDIDDAIISRCAAIIEYKVPNKADSKAIWAVLSTQFGANLNASLIDDLIDLFEGIPPRDIKMLLRLALRVSNSKSQPLDIETFRRCAMFRAVTMKNEATV